MIRTKEMAHQEKEALSAKGETYFTPVNSVIAPETGLTLSFKKLMDADAATLDTIARAIVQEVAAGNQDALETLIYAKKGAALFKAIDDNVKNYAYGKQYAAKGEQVVKFGCKIEQSELGVKYDYQSCNDREWKLLNAIFENAKTAKEEREKFLKGIKGSLDIVDKEFEVHTINEPVKTATLGYKITIK